MPSVSQAQNRFMHATAEGKTDAPVSVGKEFIAADAGTKVAHLPKHKKTRRGKRGGKNRRRFGAPVPQVATEPAQKPSIAGLRARLAKMRTHG